jgi:hypothetical protein
MKLLSVFLIAFVLQPSSAAGDRVMAAIRSAMAPALPFPSTDEAGVVPVGGDTEALWMVRPLRPGDRAIEVIANPLNEVNQLKAERAMAQIQNNIEAAQRRAAVQYDRAIAEAKRTGRSQDVDGVTLSDEGVAGARIDAESHVTIDVAIDEPSVKFDIITSIQPAPSTQLTVPGAVAIIATPSNTYREDGTGIERFAESQTVIYLGRSTAPEVRKRADHTFEVASTGTPSSLVVRLRGNEALIAELVRKTNWSEVVELLK